MLSFNLEASIFDTTSVFSSSKVLASSSGADYLGPLANGLKKWLECDFLPKSNRIMFSFRVGWQTGDMHLLAFLGHRSHR
jgi:hypothetical protein